MRRAQNNLAAIHKRRGAAYIIVMGATLIVATLGMGALLAVRAQTRNVDSYIRTAEARQNAAVAIGLGLQEMNDGSDWRAAHKSDLGGIWYSSRPIGNGTYSLKVVNPSGALDRMPDDPVVLTANGAVNGGNELQILETTVVAQITPLTCLKAALTSQSGLYLSGTDVDALNMTLATNGGGLAIYATGEIYARLEAVGFVFSYQNLGGAPTSNAPARTMPDASRAFNYYLANGTTIDIGSIPLVNGKRSISKVVLSPSMNPFGGGTTNSQGIYVIDCGGQDIRLSRSRIVGTLVIRNPGSASCTEDELHMEPAVANFPTLLVQGSFEFKTTANPLSEGGQSTNFNPPGTPFPYSGGTADNNKSGSFPNRIRGLVYVSGSCATSVAPSLDVLVVGGSTVCSNKLTLNYDSTFYLNPPPGFSSVKMIPAPGSWRQVVN